MSEPLAACAQVILHDWIQSERLRKHCYAVVDSMKHFAQLRGEDVDLWDGVGSLHDMDYQPHPNLERSATEGHPFIGVAWLRDNGWSEEVCRAILSHADHSGISRETPLEKTLYAVDELSSFVVPLYTQNRERKIAQFAKENGFHLGFYSHGLCAIFVKKPPSGDSGAILRSAKSRNQ